MKCLDEFHIPDLFQIKIVLWVKLAPDFTNVILLKISHFWNSKFEVFTNLHQK